MDAKDTGRDEAARNSRSWNLFALALLGFTSAFALFISQYFSPSFALVATATATVLVLAFSSLKFSKPGGWLAADRFILSPFATVFLLWLLAVFPTFVFLEGGFLPGPRHLTGLFAILVTALTGAIVMIAALFRRRWRAALSIAAAAIAFAALTVGSLRYSAEVHWLVWRSHYIAALTAVEPDRNGRRRVQWDGGLGWDVGLEYHATEGEAQAQNQQDKIGYGDCRTLRRLEKHYYLHGFYC